MREVQSKWKIGAHNYVGRRRRKTVWHVMVGGERELEHKPCGPAIPRTQDKQKRRAQTNNHPHAACAQTFTIVAKDDNQKEN
jgi:hypothetical protein